MFYFCIVLFFFFWINRLYTLNSQKPSLELQSPKSQGFNFNWFSCCKYNPYPPLWTFFFLYDLCEYQNFSFFFFFSNCFGIPFASSHNTPRFTKKIPPPTTNRYSDFFFSISQPAVSIFHGFSLTPPPYTGIYFNKKTNNFLCTHPVVDTHRIFIQPRSSLVDSLIFFFFTPLNPITYTQQCRFSKWVWTRSRSTMPSWRWLNSSLSRLPRFLTSKCWLGLRASPPGFFSFFLFFFSSSSSSFLFMCISVLPWIKILLA